ASIDAKSAEQTPRSNFLDVTSTLGSILSIPEVHPLSPLRRFEQIYNNKPLVKILDAPGLEDDYYLNILDWSCRDYLAIALRDRQAIVYDHVNLNKVAEFSICGHHQEICGIKFSPDGLKIATGGNDNLLCIWDFRNPSEPIMKYHEHSAAIKALSWISDNKLL